MADKLVIMADETKFVRELCRSVPVEVHPAARALVAARVQEMDGVPALRTIHHGYPAFTENGNVILDCDFGTISDPPVLASSLRELPGVLEAGIFARPDLIYRADADDFSVIKPLS